MVNSGQLSVTATTNCTDNTGIKGERKNNTNYGSFKTALHKQFFAQLI